MIAYFPNPYPDELWFSVCARFSDHMRFPTETGVMQALYGERHAVATVDLPHRLGSVISQLQPGHVCTADAVIDQHTSLPYYGPFMSTSTYASVRSRMADERGSSGRLRCGACTHRVRPPQFFRSCPVCDQENLENHREIYWRRLFQLAGVEVCPIHRVFLVSSDLRLSPLENRHRYTSSQSARHVGDTVELNSEDAAHQCLLELARAVDWLLNQQRLNPGFGFLHQRYQEILTQKGLTTRSGSVRMSDLRRAVVSRTGPRLLQLLQSEFLQDKGDGWLGQLLRKSNTSVAPLRHLILLRTLDVNLESFFFPERFDRVAEPKPAPPGPWRCFNQVCEQHGKACITRPEVLQADAGRSGTATLKCPHCGFTYLTCDPTRADTKPDRVIDFGPTWLRVLEEQWGNRGFTLRKMAKALGVDPKTVKHYASKSGLPFPRQGPRSVTRRGIYVPQGSKIAESVDSQRAAWEVLCAANPGAGTKQLRTVAPALYAWLYRNDASWFANHRPAPKPATVTLEHVDWTKRDEELAGKIATIAARLRFRSGKPLRITVTAIGRAMGKQSLFENALAKLPLTRCVINGVLESAEDFAVRRVHAVAPSLRKAEGPFPRWKLVRAAGLHHRMERHPRVQVALDYEMRPFVITVSFSDGSSRGGSDADYPRIETDPQFGKSQELLQTD